MIEITPEREEGFYHGVLYERTRILDNLRLCLQPALDDLAQQVQENPLPEGVKPVLEVEALIEWAMTMSMQPVHTMAEANHVAKDSLEMIVHELEERGFTDLVEFIKGGEDDHD